MPVLVGLVLSVLGFGRALETSLRDTVLDDLHRVLAWLVLGLFGVSGAVLLLGHLGLLRPAAMWALLGSGTVLAVGQRGPLTSGIASAGRTLNPESRFARAALGLVLLLSGLLIVSAFRAPAARDELEYHWASPLFWADQERWTDSPFRLSDSFALTEILYTLPAVTGGYVVAHLVHVFFFGVLLLAVAAGARTVGAPASVAVASVASMPVVLNQASVSYNDVAAAAYCVTAVVLLLQARASPNRLFIVGLVTAAAVSTKSLCVVLGPALVCLLIYRRYTADRIRWRQLALQVCVLAAPVMFVCAFWLIRSNALTGSFTDSEGIYLASSTDDPLLVSGAAAGRIPTALDLLLLPAVPLVTSVIGQSEPYGGRTGLGLLVLLPALVVGLVFGGRSLRVRCLPVLVPALTWFVLLAPFLIKTRFNIFTYVLLSVAGAAGFAWLLARVHLRLRAMAQIGFLAAVAVSGLVDSGRIIL